MDTLLWTLLSRADRALGRLDGSAAALPNPDLFVYMYVHKEAVLSSQIEGTQASLIDVLEFEAQAIDPGAPQDIPEVVNYVAAMQYGLGRLGELPVSLRLLREIHERLMRGVRGGDRYPGEFRRTQNWIGAAGASLRGARYVPPPPGEMAEALDRFEKFLHDPAPMPDLIKVGLAHAQFETIHPFIDGNGRMGRLLIAFLLCEQRILTRPLLYLSHFFRLHQTEYYDRLQAIRDEGDWEGWLRFFLIGVAEVAEEASVVARNIVGLREEHREIVRRAFRSRAARALQLLESLYERPILTVPYVSDLTGLTFSNANGLVKGLTEVGILEEMTGHRRNRRFMYTPYLALLTADTPAGDVEAEQALEP